MLTNSYRIQETSYNPAVGTAALVQAQAEFDAAFFASMTRAKTDQPTGNQLVTAGSDFFLLATGVEKRLPMGMSIRGQYEIRRIKQTLAFQTLNPEYRSQFALSMRQPLLRGFGIDYNRSLIVIAENRRGIDDLTLRSQVELRLREIEQLYWNLVQARRNFVIGAREVADFEAIYAYLEARKDFDVLPVSLFTTKATLKVAEAGFVRDRSRVFDAQDRLIAAMNDPDINLIDNVELIPVDFPSIERFDIDRLAEVQAALDHRTDIQAQRLAVDIQKIEVARAKNEELPQLDLTFQVTATGLSGNADRSFDEVTRGNFLSYDFVLEFRLPIGNRSARARRRQQDLGHAQATAKLRWTIEDAIRDVNLAMRELQTSYDQLAPGFDSLEARQREVNSQVARAERKDYPTLSTELAAWRALARTRADILALMVAYRNAIIDLEWKKGTLLSFNNVVIQPAGADDR
ncbi:MAG: TolC family protein, partial [Chloroflexi bacterium]|nr:TolC family protein [Chloroflexota bacterium]